MFCEHVAYSSPSHGQESTSGQPVKEAGNEHRLDVLRNGTRYHPDEKEGERADVNWSSPIEL